MRETTTARSAAALSALAVGVLVGTLAPRAATASGWRTVTESSLDERWASTQVSSVQVGRPNADDDSRLDPSSHLEHRLRLGGSVALVKPGAWLTALRLEARAEVASNILSPDGFDPLLAADPYNPAGADLASADSNRIRALKLELTTRAGQLSVGRTINRWGLGLLAQPAQDEPYQFGLKRRGHAVDRIGYLGMPAAFGGGDPRDAFPLFVALAVDRLAFDDLADRNNGDRGGQALAALLYRTDALTVGVYGVMRRQRDNDDLGIDAVGGDVFVASKVELGADWTLRFATEWVLLRGETTYFQTQGGVDALQIEQLGGAARVDLDHRMFGVRLEGGYASGDADPFDDRFGNFSASQDYRVGLVLFPEVIRRQTAVTAANLSDPRYTGTPPSGYERLATGGSWTNAIYLAPTLRFSPVDDLALLAGAVWATSPTDVMDAYQTNLDGGATTAWRGAQGKRGLGLELDAGIRYTLRACRFADGGCPEAADPRDNQTPRWMQKPRPAQPWWAGLALRAQVDAGMLLPGEAFEDAGGEAMDRVTVVVGALSLQGGW
jgi:hypothetical protein